MARRRFLLGSRRRAAPSEADVLKMRLPDIRDGFLWLTQGTTRKKLRMTIAGELAKSIAI